MPSNLVYIREKAFDAISLDQNSVSRNFDIRDGKGYSLHSYWDSVTGTVQVTTEASNDPDTFENKASNWSPIETQVLSPSNGNRMLNVEVAHYCYIRFVITQTSGTGTLTLILTGKV